MSIASSLKALGEADVIVVMKSAHEGKAAAGMPASVSKQFKGTGMTKDAALLEMLNSSGRTFSTRAAAGRTSAASVAAIAPAEHVRYYPNLGLALGAVDRAGLAALRSNPAVEKVVLAPQLRLIRPVAATAAKAKTGYSWGLKALKIDALHAKGLSGKGVIVGHLDTGVDSSHPALAKVVAAFAEFDALGNQVPNAKPKDSDEHGTHTAGTIAGQPVKGVRFGVAPGAKLVSAMVIEGGNVIARLLGGMDWVVGQNARVLSMSLGLIGTGDDLLMITRILRERGVLPVFAVGNEGPDSSRFPGNYPEALSVGASDAAGAVADFSSSQTFVRKKDPIVPDLVAPGVDVISCVPGGKYAQMSGSSMATPHIAGLAALLMEAYPNKTISQIERAIFKSTALTSSMTEDRANRGLPDGLKALAFL